jgi:arylsulfatase
MALDNTPWDPATDYTAADLTRHGRTDFYMTDATADYAIDFLDDHQSTRPTDPFMLYMSFTAPHWPLHAYESDIDNYDGIYDQGWDVIRQDRLDEMKALGLVPQSTSLTPRDGNSWASRTADDGDQDIDLDQGDLIRRMQTYAAQVDRMDQAIDKLVQYLQANNLFDNTIILFVSDNGGSNEDVTGRNRHVGGTIVGGFLHVLPQGMVQRIQRTFSSSQKFPGRRGRSYAADRLLARWPQQRRNRGDD